MKFSIVTSFYNTSEYVDKLYSSILSQTYQNWEWIVTDDFSEVSAKNQLIELSKKDSRIRYIEQEFKQEIYWNPHKYSSPDTNFVIQFDSDDTYSPKLLEVYKHFFLLHPDVMCLVSGAQRKKEDGRWHNYLFGDTRYLNGADWRTKQGPSETMLVTRAWRHVPYPTLDFNPNNVYTKRLGDLNILLKVEELGKILCLNRNLSEVIVRKKSLSNTPELMIQNSKEVENTKQNILRDVDNRRKGKQSRTIKKLHEDEYDFLGAFYYMSSLEDSKFQIVNLKSPSVTLRQLEVLKELYFELEFRVDNFDPHTSLNYFIIQTPEDFEYLKTIPSKGLRIYTTLNILDEIRKEIIKGQRHYFQILGDKKWVEIF